MRVSILVCALIALLVAPVGFAGDRYGEPAMAESSSPDDHLASASDPDSHLASSESLDARSVGSEDLDSRIVESEDPEALVVDSESLGTHQGHATALQDLPSAGAGQGPDSGSVADDPQRQRLARCKRREQRMGGVVRFPPQRRIE